jgi:DNA-binding response OmpR family regulator
MFATDSAHDVDGCPPEVRLLLVEDDDRIAAALGAALQRYGYSVDRVSTASGALEADPGQLVLLDLRLPDGDGVAVCEALRARHPVLPIIMVTARSSAAELVHGLRSGADDYVTKPFAIAELVARVEAVLRRAQRSTPRASARYSLGAVVIDVASRTVTVNGHPVSLTRKEFDLLALLADRNGEPVTRPEILEHVWHTSWVGSSRTIDVHVAQLRAKLATTDTIETVHGVGYRVKTG